MTPLAAVADFGGRRYRRFIPFNFLLSLAAPHLRDNDTGDKFIAGDNDIGDKFITGINDTAITENPLQGLIAGVNIDLSPVSLTPLNSLLTLAINIHSQYLCKFLKKFKKAPMEYLWAWGTLIYEKNLKSKISCQTPFKTFVPITSKNSASVLLEISCFSKVLTS